MRIQRLLFLLALLWLCAPLAALQAHELQPAYLELRQTDPETWRVLWKVPARADLQDAIRPRLPENCRVTSEPVRVKTTDGIVEQFSISAPGGLDNRPVAVEGAAAAIADALVRVVRSDGSTQVFRLTPTSLSHVIEPTPSRWRQAWTYLSLGVEHILMGVDHLLFVLGLLLIVRDRWMLLKTITSFTLAHSITLGIATLGYASAPLPPLNAAIALSILFLGPEMVRAERGQTSLTIRQPWLVAFAFGLLHGFGFASGLTSLGLSRGEIPLALLLFNLGVEIGQLFFIFLIVGLERSFRTLEIRWPRWAEALPAYTVGSLGAYWTIQRTAVLIAGLH
jgi:hydrogenase/urease accessory protein HupE